MRAQVGQVPTPQGISALLRKAGFHRADHDRFSSFGYRVTKRLNGKGVRVEHYSMGAATTREEIAGWVTRYAKVIRDQGWQVQESEAWPRLLVGARPVPGDNSSKEI